MPKLTALTVKSAKPGRHADGDGLYLLVKPSGAKAWLLRVQVGDIRVDAITAADISNVLTPIWTTKADMRGRCASGSGRC